MFREDKITVVDISKDRTLRLCSEGRPVCLIFIRDDKLIIRGELVVEESTIEPPEIKIM